MPYLDKNLYPLDMPYKCNCGTSGTIKFQSQESEPEYDCPGCGDRTVNVVRYALNEKWIESVQAPGWWEFMPIEHKMKEMAAWESKHRGYPYSQLGNGWTLKVFEAFSFMDFDK